MRELISRRPQVAASLLCLLVLGAFMIGQEYRVLERISFNWLQFSRNPPAQTFELQRYRVSIEAKPLEGITSNASALTYDPDRNTLFTVTNKEPELIELSLQGEVLRRIPLHDFGDPEAVEYVGPGQYVINDEYGQRLISVNVTDATTVLEGTKSDQIRVAIGEDSNQGFEGSAYDPATGRLFVAKERNPVRVYEVVGFPVRRKDAMTAIELNFDKKLNDQIFVRDLSSLAFDPRTRHLLLLSDESQQIVEVGTHGRPLDNVRLSRGNLGLTEDIPQPEGMAIDAKGTLYLISEPNLFYAFEKR